MFPALIGGVGIGLMLTPQGRQLLNNAGNFLLKQSGFPLLQKGVPHNAPSCERVPGDIGAQTAGIHPDAQGMASERVSVPTQGESESA
jgi:hypothetical protein